MQSAVRAWSSLGARWVLASLQGREHDSPWLHSAAVQPRPRPPCCRRRCAAPHTCCLSRAPPLSPEVLPSPQRTVLLLLLPCEQGYVEETGLPVILRDAQVGGVGPRGWSVAGPDGLVGRWAVRLAALAWRCGALWGAPARHQPCLPHPSLPAPATGAVPPAQPYPLAAPLAPPTHPPLPQVLPIWEGTTCGRPWTSCGSWLPATGRRGAPGSPTNAPGWWRWQRR